MHHISLVWHYIRSPPLLAMEFGNHHCVVTFDNMWSNWYDISHLLSQPFYLPTGR